MADETLPVLPELPPAPLIALTPSEMSAAQTSLGEWCAAKIAAVSVELTDAQANLKSAKEHKWKSSGFQSLVQRTRSRLAFYEKVKAAVDVGYLVIPNFPIDAFAVRRRVVEGVAPDGPGANWDSQVPNLDAQAMPLGEGNYMNPEPYVYRKTIGSNDKGEDIKRWFAHSYQDIEFPVVIAKPHIIDATQKAMELRIFDRIGLVGPASTRRDPIVVGQIFRKQGYQETTLTFFIAWWLNWEML
jgi:hypothetical protein